MVTFITPRRPVIAYLGILLGNLSAGAFCLYLKDDIWAIVAGVLAILFIAGILGLMGAAIFDKIRPKWLDELLFLNAADFAGVAALAGYSLWGDGTHWLAMAAIFAYVSFMISAVAIWLGLRAAGRAK
jgi:hypothetical protein